MQGGLVQPVRAAQANAEYLHTVRPQFFRLRGWVAAHGGHAVGKHHGHLFAVEIPQHGPGAQEGVGLIGVTLCHKALNGRVQKLDIACEGHIGGDVRRKADKAHLVHIAAAVCIGLGDDVYKFLRACLQMQHGIARHTARAV